MVKIILAYSDDIINLSYFSVEITKKLNILHEYKNNLLKIKTRRTKILDFYKGRSKIAGRCFQNHNSLFLDFGLG